MARRTYVYFISSDPAWERLIRGKIRVKIGEGYSPDGRKRELQTGNPRRLYNLRSPIAFHSKRDAQQFEAWAHRYAETRSKRILLPGGREFFDLKPHIIDEIRAKRFGFNCVKSDPFWFRALVWLLPEWLDWFLGFLVYCVLWPFKPFFWFCELMSQIGDAIEERFGYRPAGWILMYLFGSTGRIKSGKAANREVAKIQIVGNKRSSAG